LLCLGSYLILLDIKYDSRIRRRAQHDYRTARGTQHLRQLRTSLSTLRDSLRARQAKIQNLEKQLELLGRKRSAELHTTLSEHLLNERLTEVPGIGPMLNRRIIQYCFRGNLRDLRSASRIRGVGPSRQRAIMAWVHAREREFPRLLARDFPGKQHILSKYAEQERSLQETLKSERTTLGDEKRLHETALAVALRFRKAKPAHFRRALRRNSPKSPVPAWYFVGVYPPWEPMPEWFETLLSKYGS
jgi:hypothetical protein